MCTEFSLLHVWISLIIKEFWHHHIPEHWISTGEMEKPKRPPDFVCSLWCNPLSFNQHQNLQMTKIRKLKIEHHRSSLQNWIQFFFLASAHKHSNFLLFFYELLRLSSSVVFDSQCKNLKYSHLHHNLSIKKQRTSSQKENVCLNKTFLSFSLIGYSIMPGNIYGVLK